MRSLSNISVYEFRQILVLLGLEKDRTKGGHEAWYMAGMRRPVIFQTHKEPVPEFVVKNAIRDLGMTRETFLEVLDRI